MKRRDFLRNSFLGTAGFSVLGGLANSAAAAPAAKAPVKLTILHTNDMHSRIEPFPDNGGQWAGLGGMARRAALIKDIRSKEANVLLLDSGDIFQGTPYFNFFGGELEYKLMSQMAYDASTLGNHDFRQRPRRPSAPTAQRRIPLPHCQLRLLKNAVGRPFRAV